jgi:hypothetical protein
MRVPDVWDQKRPRASGLLVMRMKCNAGQWINQGNSETVGELKRLATKEDPSSQATPQRAL